MRARGVDERDQRKTQLSREAHDPRGLAKALRTQATTIPFWVAVAALLADRTHRHAGQVADTGDHCLIVAEDSIAA